MLKKIALSLALTFPVLLCAQIESKTVTAQGQAANLSAAVKFALVEAVSQINGVDVSAVQKTLDNTYNSYAKISRGDSANESETTKLESAYQSDINTATNGFVQSYEIINQQKTTDGWQVTLKVKLSSYQTIDERSQLKMYSVAILPFNIQQGAIKGEVNQASLQDSIEQAIQNQFTQSRKFRVVSRSAQDQAAYAKEMSLIFSDRASPDQKARFGKQIGADFLLVGDVDSVVAQKTTNTFYGEIFTQWNISASIRYRMIETATMEVKWSNTINVSIPKAQATKEVEVSGGQVSSALSKLYLKLGNDVADQLIGLVYPMTVLTTEGDDVYLNQGADRIQVGQKFRIRSMAKNVIDPMTGQHIPVQGRVIGTVKITEVMPKYSIAGMVNGDIKDIKSGQQAFLVNK